MHSRAVRQSAPRRAHQHAQAALLQYMHVVVVGVPHGPAGGVAAGLLARGRVHAAHVAVAPLAEGVEGGDARDHGVVYVPLGRGCAV